MCPNDLDACCQEECGAHVIITGIPALGEFKHFKHNDTILQHLKIKSFFTLPKFPGYKASGGAIL